VAGPPHGICSAHGSHTFKARAGHHLAPQLLSSGRNIFEELGTGITLIALDGDEHIIQSFDQAAKSLNIPLKVVRDTREGGREQYEAPLFLVRPDQYVVWTGDRKPADFPALFRKIVGRH
jgi:hypothetical protein